jgi:hypothetical protein
VVITVASICCMMIVDATIIATSFGFADGDIVRRAPVRESAGLP